MAQAPKPIETKWPYPPASGRVLCPVCWKSFLTANALVAHQFDKRHWRKVAEKAEHEGGQR